MLLTNETKGIKTSKKNRLIKIIESMFFEIVMSGSFGKKLNKKMENAERKIRKTRLVPKNLFNKWIRREIRHMDNVKTPKVLLPRRSKRKPDAKKEMDASLSFPKIKRPMQKSTTKLAVRKED